MYIPPRHSQKKRRTKMVKIKTLHLKDKPQHTTYVSGSKIMHRSVKKQYIADKIAKYIFPRYEDFLTEHGRKT
jgi:hypothetical protein